MSFALNAGARKKLNAIREEFAQKLPEKISRLFELWRNFKANPQEESIETALGISHNLAGSAASFGFRDVSQAARQLELLLAEIEPATAASNLQSMLVDGLIENMERAAHFQSPEPMHLPESTQQSVYSSTLRQIEERSVYILAKDTVFSQVSIRQLANFNFTVRMFNSAERLVNALAKHSPAILLLRGDCVDEVLTGFLKASAVRKTEPRQIIFYSLYDSFENRMTALRLGAKKFLAGIIQINQLVQHIESLLLYDENHPYRVLLVDDAQDLAETYAVILEASGLITQRVTKIEDLLSILADFRPDIIILDLYMPNYSGFEIALMIRQLDEYIGVPIIYLSTETSHEKQLKAMTAGADDFLTKPVDWSSLARIIRLRAERSRILRERIARDALTLLWNHSAIHEHLEIEVKRANLNDWPLSVVMIDIDDFKHVNDTYGHVIGDSVIRGLASFLGNNLRNTDKIARYGGEEFLVVMPDTTPAAAYSMIDIVRTNFALIPFAAGGKAFHVTFSAGIAELQHPDTSVVARADAALYEAKNSGKNRVIAR